MDEPIRVRIMYMLLTIFILLALVAFSKWCELAKERKLKQLVAWSVVGDYWPQDLLHVIWAAQTKIDEKYRITKDSEKEYLRQILHEFQRDISRQYISGALRISKKMYSAEPNEFFMIQFHDYIEKHLGDEKFLKLPLAECDSYPTYRLTELGTVFYKLRYITHIFCKNNSLTNPSGYPNWEDYIEAPILEVLDTGEYTLNQRR